MVNGGERANTTSYEEERAETLRISQEKLHQLIPRLAEKSSHEQNNKTKKRQHTYSQPALEMPRRVLRSDTARADSRHDDEDMRDAALEENEDDVNAATQHDGGQQQKKRGRSYTRKADIRSRGNQPPIRLEINEKGQPVGDNATEFANFIATLVKNSEIISLAKPDWRLVEPKQKLLLWNTLKLYYEVDERVKDWVMGSAAKKWRDFKSDLKALYFDEEKTDEELLAVCDDNRVHEDDWKWLIDHWRTEGSKQRSEIGKLNRQGMTLFHTTGSKSHARVIEEEHKKNGYPPRRDEAFVITHTSKKGVPSNAAATKKIKELENKANEQPELLEKTIEQGDLFSQVFGKKRNGYVRCIGLGPSASDLRMPGTRKLKSTKLQMAEEECRQAMEEAALLRERVEATDRKMDIVMNEVLEMKKMMLASQAKEKEQFSPHYDSNSALNGYIDDEGENSETGYMAAEKHDDHVISSRPMLENQAEITHHKKQVLVQQMNQLDHQNTTVTQKTPQVGQDVILYSISRPYNIPVAKATIQSIDRTKIVAGAELGSQCCEVVVNMVMKKDAILQRPYGNVRTMANALGRSIAWPRRYIEVIRKDMQKQP